MQSVDDLEHRPRAGLRTAWSYNPCANADRTKDGCAKCTINGSWKKKICFKQWVVDRVKP